MINNKAFYDLLIDNRVDYFCGVPDSLLKSFCAYITAYSKAEAHVITANEGAAVGLAIGHHLATNNLGLVYLQNSGLGNIINPLLSLADKDVYSVPMVLLIGWRGQPGVKDEPQHVKQGRVTEVLLSSMGVPYIVLKGGDFLDEECQASIVNLIDTAKRDLCPVAILVEKNTFDAFSLEEPESKSLKLSREQAIDAILSQAEQSALVVSTTGMISREVFEIREKYQQGHAKDFLTVGGMGHASMIAQGVAKSKADRTVYLLDGDGALLMHMGSMAILGQNKNNNLVHIVLNNGAHDSVGGQPTLGFDIEICQVAKACGYAQAVSVEDIDGIKHALENVNQKGISLIEIKVSKGNRADLGRPTTTPIENKQAFMNNANE